MAKTYTEEYVRATQIQADSNEAIALDTNETDIEVAKLESNAVIEQARYDYLARLEEAQTNLTIQMEALRVREYEAELTYKVDYKNAMSEAVRADAAYLGAEATYKEAENEEEEISNEYEIDKLKQEDDNDDYWYG